MNDFISLKTNFLDEAETTHPKIHLRIQKRNGKKSITIIEGLDPTVCHKILKVVRKVFCTSGIIVNANEDGNDGENEDGEVVMQLQGDCRVVMGKWLVENGFTKKEDLVLHGA